MRYEDVIVEIGYSETDITIIDCLEDFYRFSVYYEIFSDVYSETCSNVYV